MMAHRTVLGLILALLTTTVFAHDAKVGDLVIMEPWARATIGQGKTAAAYLTVVNHGAAGDRLVAVSTPVAGKAALHTHIMEEGVAKMRPVEALEIQAKGSTALKPGGLHVMLMNLEQPLKEGEAFPMTLTFETAGEVEVEVHVQAMGAMQPAGSEAMSHGSHDAAMTSHDHGAHDHGKLIALATGPTAPTLDIMVAKDKVGGWNLHVLTTNFRFAPENVNTPHRDGEGHAHLYVNGEKIARLYGPWFHIGSLPSGPAQVTVTLNANDHSGLAVGDAPLSVTKEVHVH